METLRRRLKDYLRDGPRSLREISQELRISEDEAEGHLEHLARTKGGERLTLTPAECLSCGYVFRKRQRVGKPSRCPVCRGEHVSSPLYSVSARGGA